MRTITNGSFLLFLAIIVMLPCHARGDNLWDCEKQFKFAESLLEQADFYRAIGEYKRLIFLCPDAVGFCENAYFKTGVSYYRAKKWQGAIEAFNTFLLNYPDSRMFAEAMYLKGMSEKNLSLYDEALVTFGRIIETEIGEYQARATYQSALVLMDMKKWDRAGKMFSRVSGKSSLYDSAYVFSAGLDNIDNIQHKSPAVAGTLAAIIPGAGHLYTERLRDAVVAFLLNGVFIWSAVELFHDEKYVTGGIVTFFELGWYTGNIYSAVSSAHKFNKRTQKDFLQGLKNRVSLSYFHDRKSRSNYLMLSMNF
ncbi:MAG: tetratricopeptide repeat protein [Thermodesulfobacteriota bacterium]|nr:tetratricopeptide repeat protein [Thermodesulfobacteriota bacterium]